MFVAIVCLASYAAPIPQDAPSIVSDINSAAKHAAGTNATKLRYLSLAGLSKKEREAVETCVNFALNSSGTSRVIRKCKVYDDLLVADLDGLSIKTDNWDRFCVAAGEPYYRIKLRDGKMAFSPHLNNKNVAFLVKATGTVYPVVRADWFLQRIGDGYQKELMGATTIGAYKLMLRLNHNHTRDLETRSMLAKSGRIITRHPTVVGAVWSDTHVEKPMESLLVADGDSSSYVGHLPNGLLAYYSGSKDKLAPSPGSILAGQSKTSKGCINCHSNGIEPIDCDLRATLKKDQDIDLKARDQQTAKLLLAYTVNVASLVKEDNQRYAKAVKAATDWTTEKLSSELSKVQDSYCSKVTPQIAASELGMGLAFVREKLTNQVVSVTLATLLAGRNVSRLQWERDYGNILLSIR